MKGPEQQKEPVVVVAGSVPPATANAVVTTQPLHNRNRYHVGQVISVSPLMPTMGTLQVFEGVVLTEKQNWPFPLCCSACPCAHCCKDPGLCCYACCFPTCLGAEISAKIGNKGCCGTEECCSQWCAAWSVALCVGLLGLVCCGVGSACSLCVWTTVLSQTRDAQKAVYQLPADELCCQNSCTSFLPLPFCDCTCCALYQQAFYLKYAQHIDMDCCCYKCLCACQRPDDRLANDSPASTNTTALLA